MSGVARIGQVAKGGYKVLDENAVAVNKFIDETIDIKTTNKATFTPSDAKEVLKQLNKEGIAYGYTEETLAKLAAKKINSLLMTEAEVESLFKIAEKYIGTALEFDPNVVKSILRFDPAKAANKDYVANFQLNLAEVVEDQYQIAIKSAKKADKKMTREDIINSSFEDEWGDFFETMLSKKTGDTFKNRTETLKAVLMKESIEIELDSLSKVVSSGNADIATKLKLVDVQNVARLILPKIYGGISETGASLQALSRTGKYSKEFMDASTKTGSEYVDVLTDILNSNPGIEYIDDFAKNYLLLDKKQKPKFVKRTRLQEATNTANSLYVLGLLGSPETQLRNIFNNTFKQITAIIETPIASMMPSTPLAPSTIIKKIKSSNPRTTFVQSDDVESVEMIDTLIGVIAEVDAFKHAWKNAGKAFKHNEALDPTQKMLSKERKAFKTPEEIDAEIGSIKGTGIYKTLAKGRYDLITAAGRGLVTADEFFATLSFNRVLLTKAYKEAYEVMRKTGDTEQAKTAFAKFITDFDPADVEGTGKAFDVAQTDRFVSNPEAVNGVERWISRNSSKINNPILKFYIPMQRVFQEMVRQVVELTPGLGMVGTSRARAGYREGGAAQQKLLAKQFAGLILIEAIATNACDVYDTEATFCITGSGPRTQEGREANKSVGLVPYSFHWRENPQAKWESQSYELAQPYAGLLAIGANLGAIAYDIEPEYDEQWSQNFANALKFAGAVVAPIADVGAYFTPVKDMFDDVTGLAYPDKGDYIGKWLVDVPMQYASTVVMTGTGGIATSPSFLGWVEKVFDPSATVAIPEELTGQAFDDIAGYNTGIEDWIGVDFDRAEYAGKKLIQKITNRIPGLNDDSPVAINLRGETQYTEKNMITNAGKIGKGVVGFAKDVVGLTNEKEVELFPTENYLFNQNVTLPSIDIGSQDAKFTERQYENWRNSLVTSKLPVTDRSGNAMFDGEPLTLMQAIDKIVQEDGFKNLPSKSKYGNGKQDVVDAIAKQYQDNAYENVRRVFPDFLGRELKKKNKNIDSERLMLDTIAEITN